VRRVLVAGVGNLFLSDDAFGVEVANRLVGRPQPEGVRVADFGIKSVHLAYELLEGYDALVLVDAVPLGEAPGTLAVIEPDLAAFGLGRGDRAEPGGEDSTDGEGTVLDAHVMSPEAVLASLARLGGSLERAVVVGCQPASLEEGIGLSPAVAAALEPAVACCEDLISELATASPAGVGSRTGPPTREPASDRR